MFEKSWGTNAWITRLAAGLWICLRISGRFCSGSKRSCSECCDRHRRRRRCDKGGAPAGPPSGSSEGTSSSAPPALSAGEGGVTGGGWPAGPPSGSSAGTSSAATPGPPSGSSAGASSAATQLVHHQAPAQAQTPLQLLVVPAGLPSGSSATEEKAQLDAAIAQGPLVCLPPKRAAARPEATEFLNAAAGYNWAGGTCKLLLFL